MEILTSKKVGDKLYKCFKSADYSLHPSGVKVVELAVLKIKIIITEEKVRVYYTLTDGVVLEEGQFTKEGYFGTRCAAINSYYEQKLEKIRKEREEILISNSVISLKRGGGI